MSPKEERSSSAQSNRLQSRLPLNRREYLQYTGAATAGSLLTTGNATAEGESDERNVPTPINLRTEYEKDPTNIFPSSDHPPRFFWEVPTTQNDIKQTGYQIRVWTEDADLSDPNIWDSDRVNSHQLTAIKYNGKPLEADTTYHWSVRIWDTNKNRSNWSEPAHFTTALPDNEDYWEGDWIGMDTTGDVLGDLSPLLRRNISINKAIESARAHLVTLGYGELYINGQQIGDEKLNPAKTEYRERVLYTTYDIEGVLESGENALGIWLGRGWYGFVEGEGQWDGAASNGGPPKTLLQLNINYADGTTRSVVTNTGWTMEDSSLIETQIYDGETYNALEDQPEWSLPGFNDNNWKDADKLEPPAEDFKLRPQRLPPIQITETLSPENIVEREDGYLVDFGQNHTGWLELTIAGADKGDRIVMQHAEVLMTEDDRKLTRNPEAGKLNLIDLREADARDTYIAKGDAEETYEPRFTYHGFRYVLVSGYPGELTPEDIQSKVVHTGFDQTGSFACSNENLNQVQHNAVWGLRSNGMSHPTDCAQRDERFGFTGDVNQNVHSDFYNFSNANRFHEKWILDHNDNQDLHQEGYVTNILPVVEGGETSPADPNWGRSRVIMPWRMYLQTGDKSILKESYQGMRNYVDYWLNRTENNILPAEFGSFGDWLAFEGRPEEGDDRYAQTNNQALFNTGTQYQVTDLFAKAAGALGHNNDKETYRERADAIAEAFHREFYNPNANSYGTGTQTTYAQPLFLGIVPENHDEAVANSLAEKIRTEDDGKLLTGFLGTRPLIYSLVDYGYEDLAYNVVSQPEQPGWVYMVEQGATTMWERWDSDEQIGFETSGRMNSFNHRPWTLVSEWFYQKLAGIGIGEPGFEHVEISPMVVEDLDWVVAETDTVRGRIGSSWERISDAGIKYKVSIPGNTTATVNIPTLGSDKIRAHKDGKTIWNNGNKTQSGHSSTKSIDQRDDQLEVKIGSGTHQFKLNQIDNK